MIFGEPEDVSGQCNSKLYLADNFGDNHCTIRCQLEPNHSGRHKEQFNRGDTNKVTIEWEKDEHS